MPIQFYNLIEIDFNLCGSSVTSIFEKYFNKQTIGSCRINVQTTPMVGFNSSEHP